VGGCEAADGGDEGEEEVFGDEAPGEQADDGADLAADDRAESDADRSPERRARDGAEQEEGDLVAVEGEVDAAAGECGVADCEAESFGDDAEDEAGEESGCELGGEDARAWA
jgi:AAA ATPase containing von Willebrand factor type A (vWA) domain